MSELPAVLDISVTELFDHAAAARELLERSWSPETAYQGIALTPDDPPSRGQCGVSSLWFGRYLRNLGIAARFVEGRIGLDDLREEHVWVDVPQQSGEEALVADLTSDQYRTVNGVLLHVGVYDSGQGTIGSYLAERHFVPGDIIAGNLRRKLLGRLAILDRNIARLPARHRRWLDGSRVRR